MKRRSFLGLMGAAGAGLAVPASARAGVKDFRGFLETPGVLFDGTRCIGCRKCELACNQVNNLPEPEVPFDNLEILDSRRRTDASTFTVVNKFETANGPVYRKNQCNHCLEPACASSCFVAAFRKNTDSAVDYDDSVCVGCRYCMIACPFEIPTYEYHKVLTPRVMKCTLCGPQMRAGELRLPGCVEICPVEAMIYGPRNELINLANRRFKQFPGRYVERIYGEHEMGGTSWMYISGTPFRQVGLREDLGTKSAPELTAGALAAVPVVVAVWPVLLGGIYAINKRKEKIAAQEQKQAVAAAVAKTKEEAEEKLATSLSKAEEAANRRVDNEVKKAVKEALAKKEEELKAADASKPDEEEGK
ncbi:sulfate respiration complex iron-sulfur protein HmcB [Desulfonatronum thioautotrophicum]|uniref:sulfate respiration complex iron-sulfur protein HmcB n=1 Tax=Desulfonatronum thioautotrophicum TaxID=617001 RepID=UPI0005EB8C09|nr:4Fe-4S dicluster domain-containing protein [Desulfonatronum thioautotrophicum]